jgi:hypothetical protein
MNHKSESHSDYGQLLFLHRILGLRYFALFSGMPLVGSECGKLRGIIENKDLFALFLCLDESFG